MALKIFAKKRFAYASALLSRIEKLYQNKSFYF